MYDQERSRFREQCVECGLDAPLGVLPVCAVGSEPLCAEHACLGCGSCAEDCECDPHWSCEASALGVFDLGSDEEEG